MTGSLFVSRATAEAIQRSVAVVALIGGYDGSGNFGDIALLDAGLQAVAGLGPDVLALPVIECGHAESHRALRDERQHVALFDGAAEPLDALARFVPPPGFTGVYLYGGGYLNRRWGARKLAMARAALDAMPDAACVSSGLQADAEWVGGLGPADRELLARFAPFGVRDPLSATALAPLGPSDLTGDDAVGVLPAPSGVEPQPIVNVHVSDHGWVTADSSAVVQRWCDVLDALDDAGERPAIQPLVAYHDATTSDTPATQQFAATCRHRGLEVADPLVLRPEQIGEVARVIESGMLTLSGSYHVALTSLLLGVPTALASENSYYRQKAAGLHADFGLRVPDDPERIAALADETVRARLREHGLSVRARRARAEAALAWRFAGAAVTGTAARLRHHAGYAAELRAELAHLRLELQARERQATGPWLQSDARMQVEHAQAAAAAARDARAREAARRRELEAQVVDLRARLQVVYSSKSWALTSPLRTAVERARRLRRSDHP